MAGRWSDVPSGSFVRPPSLLDFCGDGPSSVAGRDARSTLLAVCFRRFSGVSGSVGPLFPSPFSDRRKGSGGICGTPLAGQPPEAAALRHSGGLGPVAASFPVLSRAGVRRIGNGIFRDTGGAALVPEKESPFGIGACPRRARDAAIGSIRPLCLSSFGFTGECKGATSGAL